MTKENNLVEVKFVCPCCGYPDLDVRPYKKAPNPPYNLDIVYPPYEDVWDFPSYDVCACCGFEFGNDDHGMSYNKSFQEYLKEWIADGCVWFYEDQKPKDWSLERQLKNAGLKMP